MRDAVEIGDDITLPSGRRLTPNAGIIGIAPNGELFGGYDQPLEDYRDQDSFALWPVEDRIALAKIAIERWIAWAQNGPMT